MLLLYFSLNYSFFMSDPFLAEIKIFSFQYAPKGWAFCNGQLMPIAQNQALFSLLGTTYGGNGQTTFALPNLQERTPLHRSGSLPLGQSGGEAWHTLTQSEIPPHNHVLQAAAPANGAQNVNNPNGAFLSNSAPAEIYNSGAGGPAQVAMNPATVATYGSSQPHENMQPYLVLNFCIAMQGIFPPHN
jgi:microcystin-dependent protein